PARPSPPCPIRPSRNIYPSSEKMGSGFPGTRADRVEAQGSMTKRPKSRRKSKSENSRAPAPTSVHGKEKRPRTEQASRDPLDDFVEAAARALNLKVQPAWKGPVKANLA